MRANGNGFRRAGANRLRDRSMDAKPPGPPATGAPVSSKAIRAESPQVATAAADTRRPPHESQAGKPLRDRDVNDDNYLTDLGRRVRSRRAIRGMSRKVFAHVSGVSERYIAQIESGRGNLSILVLRRLAQATGTTLEDLVCEEPGQADDWMLVRDLLRRASPDAISKAKAVLASATAASHPAPVTIDRVALIGLRGAGKSTLGRLAAERQGWAFVELNKEIERENGLSMTEIFSLYGQEGYRRLEQEMLQGVVARPGPMILATGGGIVAEPLTFDRLLTSFFTVWIKAAPEEHMSRVRLQGDLRPMGNDRTAMAELVTILSSREPLYERARAVVDTTGASIETSLEALLATIRS
jgi:XRE family transcriptional regulator, aerobic/anaerobic benzoate catabolism transcriptional regulator